MSKPHEMLAVHGMLRRSDPSRIRVDLRGRRFGGIVKQRGKYQDDLVVRSKRRPVVQFEQPSTDQFRMRPDITFRMPLGILGTFRHRPTRMWRGL